MDMNSSMDEISLLRQAPRSHHHHHHHHHHPLVDMEEDIHLEMGGPGDEVDPAAFAHAAAAHASLVSALPPPAPSQHDDHKQLLVIDIQQQQQQPHQQQQQQQSSSGQPSRKKKKVVKKWRDEWADTYKWAYTDTVDNTTRIFCSICKEYGRKHRRNPYGNEGSRNMQMSALEEHNNSLLHKEALRLQMASKDKSISSVERPVYVKALLCKSAESIVEAVIRKDPHEVEYIQAVREIVRSLQPVLSKSQQFVHILERMVEPERVIIFRVPWVDDKGETHVNRGFRVQFSQALGPCRGGLRFHPSTNLSITKFLGLEQTFKNALSPYKLGGSGGGSDFDPKGKSENEIMRFCQSFMDELYRHLGPNHDLPAEDAGVGPREMGYLFGQYRRLAGEFQGSFVGPRSYWSSSSLRTDATGYGLVYFTQLLLGELNKELKGLRCVVSGAGKIAMNVLEKLVAYGAVPITISDTKGYLLDESGFDYEKLTLLRDIRLQQRSLREYLKTYSTAKYFEEEKPWRERCDIAFPCASQYELCHADAVALVNGGCRILIEGSNMPCSADAVEVLRKYKVLVGPSKAASAGGVGIAELEGNHDVNLLNWFPEDIETKLQESMKQIFQKSLKAATDYGYLKDSPEYLVHGGNIAAFLTIAQCMIEQGCV